MDKDNFTARTIIEGMLRAFTQSLWSIQYRMREDSSYKLYLSEHGRRELDEEIQRTISELLLVKEQIRTQTQIPTEV